MKVGTHEKSFSTFVGNAIYVSVLGLIDPRVKLFFVTALDPHELFATFQAFH